MNTHTVITRPAITATVELLRLMAKARSIVEQAAASGDDEEKADLTSDLLETNNLIIQMPAANLEDVRAKAQHLIWVLEDGSDPMDCGCLEALLRSLIGEVMA